jgi:hypothetical protein
MTVSVSPLTREFLLWVSSRTRTYDEAMEVWRTSCPRHSVWEDALIEGLIRIEDVTRKSRVVLTPRGEAALNGAPDP